MKGEFSTLLLRKSHQYYAENIQKREYICLLEKIYNKDEKGLISKK